MLSLLIFLVYPSVLATTTQVSRDNVVFIVELTRHGARTPEHTFKKIKWVDDLGLGKLTDTGTRMSYYLGLNTKYRYPEFFSNPLKDNEYKIKSTTVGRTIKSAIAHTIGMTEVFRPTENLLFKNDDIRLRLPQMIQGGLFNFDSIDFESPLPFGFKPFPVYPTSLEKPTVETYLCTGWKKSQKHVFQSTSEILERSEFFNNLYQWVLSKYNLTKDWKSTTSKFLRIYELADFAIMDYLNNPNPLIDPNDPLFKYLEDVIYLHNFQSYNETIPRKVYVTPGLYEISS